MRQQECELVEADRHHPVTCFFLEAFAAEAVDASKQNTEPEDNVQ